MLNLKDILPKQIKIKKSNHSTRHQVRGSEICTDLGLSNYGIVIGLYKRYPKVVERVYSFMKDAPNIQSREKFFLWAFKKFRMEMK